MAWCHLFMTWQYGYYVVNRKLTWCGREASVGNVVGGGGRRRAVGRVRVRRIVATACEYGQESYRSYLTIFYTMLD